MRPEAHTRAAYVAAFRELVARIAASLADVPKRARPIRMFVAGGAALHFYTGDRVSLDVDAVFSRRIVLPENLEVAYQDADGAPRLLYFDRQYNDTLGLLHEDARADSRPLSLPGIDAKLLDVRLLAPVDLAVSKLARHTDQDRADIVSLGRHGLLDASAVRRRATESVAGYIGHVDRLQQTIERVTQLVAAEQPRRRR